MAAAELAQEIWHLKMEIYKGDLFIFGDLDISGEGDSLQVSGRSFLSKGF